MNLTSRVRLILKAVFGAAAIVTLSLVTMYYLPGLRDNWYWATYKCGLKFVGTKSKGDGRVEYFSLRVGGDDAQAIPVECPLVFHWKGKKYLVRELGLNDLVKMGIPSESVAEDRHGIVTAFIAGDDSNNQDYGVEFHFRNGRICDFYARHRSQNGVACPFMPSVNGREPVAFPVGEQELRESFGAPESVVALPGK